MKSRDSKANDPIMELQLETTSGNPPAPEAKTPVPPAAPLNNPFERLDALDRLATLFDEIAGEYVPLWKPLGEVQTAAYCPYGIPWSDKRAANDAERQNNQLRWDFWRSWTADAGVAISSMGLIDDLNVISVGPGNNRRAVAVAILSAAANKETERLDALLAAVRKHADTMADLDHVFYFICRELIEAWMKRHNPPIKKKLVEAAVRVGLNQDVLNARELRDRLSPMARNSVEKLMVEWVSGPQSDQGQSAPGGQGETDVNHCDNSLAPLIKEATQQRDQVRLDATKAHAARQAEADLDCALNNLCLSVRYDLFTEAADPEFIRPRVERFLDAVETVCRLLRLRGWTKAVWLARDRESICRQLTESAIDREQADANSRVVWHLFGQALEAKLAPEQLLTSVRAIRTGIGWVVDLAYAAAGRGNLDLQVQPKEPAAVEFEREAPGACPSNNDKNAAMDEISRQSRIRQDAGQPLLVCPGSTVAVRERRAYPIAKKNYSLDQHRLICMGFYPGWWLPADLAENWKTDQYPLEGSHESVREWVRLNRELQRSAFLMYGMNDEGSIKQKTWQSGLENDFALLQHFDPSIVADCRPKSNSDTGSALAGKSPFGGSPLSRRAYTIAELKKMSGLANTALNGYTRLANVPRATRGKKNHTFTAEQVRLILVQIIERCTEEATRSRCRTALDSLK